MEITIKYKDDKSLTKEEVVKYAEEHFGKSAKVMVMPDSTNAHDFIYFGIQQIITHEQLSLLFDSSTYQQDLKKLRAETLYKLSEILDTVIVDNESKVSG